MCECNNVKWQTERWRLLLRVLVSVFSCGVTSSWAQSPKRKTCTEIAAGCLQDEELKGTQITYQVHYPFNVSLSFWYWPIDDRAFQRRSFQPISWFESEETKPNMTKASNARIKWSKLTQKHIMLNLNKHTFCYRIFLVTKDIHKRNLNVNKHVNLRTFTCVRISLCTTVVHYTAQNSSDYFPSWPPDNHHSSDAVYWREGESLSFSSTWLRAEGTPTTHPSTQNKQ